LKKFPLRLKRRKKLKSSKEVVSSIRIVL